MREDLLAGADLAGGSEQRNALLTERDNLQKAHGQLDDILANVYDEPSVCVEIRLFCIKSCWSCTVVIDDPQRRFHGKQISTILSGVTEINGHFPPSPRDNVAL